MNSINKGGNIRTITNEECDFLKGGLKGNSKKVDSIYRLHKKICKVCGKNDQQLPTVNTTIAAQNGNAKLKSSKLGSKVYVQIFTETV